MNLLRKSIAMSRSASLRRSALRRTAAAALAGLLAACNTMAPRYERPAAPVASTFPAAPASAPGAGAPAAAQPWRAFFTDARLDQLIAAALANNRDLRVSMLNIEVARAQVGLSRAGEFPTIDLQGKHTRETGLQTVDTVGLAVAGYELDLWGRVRSLTDAALAQLSATEEARKAAQISLVASVANAYYAMAGDQALLDVAQQTLKTRTDTLQLIRLRLANGVASAIDLQLNTSLVETARIAFVAAQRQRALDQNALELLIGGPLPAQLPAAPAWDDMALPDVPVGLSSDVLLDRPDVRQAEQQLIAANADIGAARAAFFPTISLTGSYGTASTSLSGLFDHAAWSFIPQVSLPIFDAGRTRNNLRVSEAQRDLAVAQYEKAVQVAFRDVADALAGRATLADQLSAQQAQTAAEAARFKLADMLFTNGVASSLDQLDAQRSLFASQQALVQVKLALLQNRIAVFRALGGGWTETATPAS
jgi:multidrug efflux system outer membrane protein